MTARHHPLPRAFLLFIILLALLLPRQAAGLAWIRHEDWSFRGQVPPAPDGTVVSVAFFANVADMDLPSRVVFSIVVQDGGTPQTLLEFRWGQWVEIAGPGTPINVFASFRLSCDGEGRLVAEPLETWFGFCTFGQYALDVRNLQNVQTFPVQVSETFGLALMDRGGLLGTNPPPADAFACSGSGVPVLGVDAARAHLAQMKGTQSQRLAASSTGSIGLYFDRAGTVCSGTIQPDQPGKVYVVAKMNGMSECGIAGAEFRFTGVPASWRTHPVTNPEILSIGDPLGDGVTVAFRCQRPEDGYYVLYEVLVLADREETDLEFRIRKRNPATSPDFDCPLLVLCDFPAFTKICVDGMGCTVNARAPRLCSTPVAVERSTWGSFKTFYRCRPRLSGLPQPPRPRQRSSRGLRPDTARAAHPRREGWVAVFAPHFLLPCWGGG